MARTKSAMTKQSAAAGKSEERRRTNAELSAYFARREAAKVLRLVLQGDARRRPVGSIKSLVYSPSVRNKKPTFALVCQTLKQARGIGLYNSVRHSFRTGNFIDGRCREVSVASERCSGIGSGFAFEEKKSEERLRVDSSLSISRCFETSLCSCEQPECRC